MIEGRVRCSYGRIRTGSGRKSTSMLKLYDTLNTVLSEPGLSVSLFTTNDIVMIVSSLILRQLDIIPNRKWGQGARILDFASLGHIIIRKVP